MAVYEKLVVLNKDIFRNHKLKTSVTPVFLDTQTIPVLGIEFAEAAKEFPIVFVKNPTKDEISPMVLLGLQKDENLFVNKEGGWNSRYVPAFVRRYPFILADAGGNQLVLCLDENFEGLNTEDGVALFDDGKETEYLKDLIQFVTSFHNDSIATGQFTASLKALDLLEEKSLKAELKDGREFTINGFYVVNEEKLRSLDSENAQQLFYKGELAWVYAHLISLSNLKRLVDLS